MLRGRRLLLSLVPAVALACGDDDGGHVAPDDAGAVVDAGPHVTVHTKAPSFSLSLPGPNNATLAMAIGDDHAWHVMTPQEPGLYAVPFHDGRWTAAFVCADRDNAYVRIYDLSVDQGEFHLDLDSPCALESADVGDLTGHFAHAPPGTTWFDFAYVADERGSSLPLNGDGADYELVNVVSGKWDLIFGFRDDAAGPLTKLFIVRDEMLQTAGTKLDVDLGNAAFVPGSKALTVRGNTADEYLTAPVIYTVGGSSHGIDVGPQSALGPNLVYSTVPADKQGSGDQYLLALTASASDGSGTRGAKASFHDAVDVTLDLPPPLEPPVVTKLGDAPYLRASIKAKGRAAAGLHEIAAITEVTDQKRIAWFYSTNAAFADGAEVSFEMPDFSSLPGWNNAWAIQADRTKIVTTLRERTSPLSDGAIERFSTSTVRFNP